MVINQACGFPQRSDLSSDAVHPFIVGFTEYTELMGKRKRKLSPKEKADKKRRQLEYKTVFMNGKQKRVKRELTIDGIPVDDFIRENADPIWLMQNEMHEELHVWEMERDANFEDESDEDLPF
ncbi:MAG: hypothetical protein PF904_14830 [Kiritimatiellae bacterium]|nr:hypothetical protein [Kiritimatiellia bacterium]